MGAKSTTSKEVVNKTVNTSTTSNAIGDSAMSIVGPNRGNLRIGDIGLTGKSAANLASIIGQTNIELQRESNRTVAQLASSLPALRPPDSIKEESALGVSTLPVVIAGGVAALLLILRKR